MRDALVRVALIAWGGIALSATVPDAAYAASSLPPPNSTNVPVGPNQVSTHSTGSPQSTNVAPPSLAAPQPAVTPPKPPAPPPAMVGPTSPSAGPAGTNARRITEIVPPPSYAGSGAPIPPKVGALARTDLWTSADPCVNVFVRSAMVDGRDVMSVDLHGDGLIKTAVPPPLAGELLARAGSGPGVGGARTACVPPALAQSLFSPVVNVAAVDPAVRMTRVGERWVLAGNRAPEPVAKTAAPVQLAAATTRGAAKKPTKKGPRAPAKPVQVSYNIFYP